jgi:hypothetical protein
MRSGVRWEPRFVPIITVGSVRMLVPGMVCGGDLPPGWRL